MHHSLSLSLSLSDPGGNIDQEINQAPKWVTYIYLHAGLCLSVFVCLCLCTNVCLAPVHSVMNVCAQSPMWWNRVGRI